MYSQNYIPDNKSDISAIYRNYPKLINPKADPIVLDDDDSIIDLSIIRKFRDPTTTYKYEKTK